MRVSNRSRSSRWSRFLVAGALFFGLGAAVVADDVAKAPAAEAKTGRIEGQIKLPELPRVKIENEALKAIAAESPQVALHSVSLLVPNARDPLAEVQPDAEGRFVFENVPAGRVSLRPNFIIVGYERQEAIGQSFSMGPVFSPRAYVKAGKTSELTFFGEGRPVSGKLALPEWIKPENVEVRLTMIAPPVRALYGNTGKGRTPTAVAYALVKPYRELKSKIDADGQFKIAGVREGRYRISVSASGLPETQRLAFDGVAQPGQEHVEYSLFDVPLMKDGTNDKPLDLGTLRFTIAAN
jgi:hypothetical protein